MSNLNKKVNRAPNVVNGVSSVLNRGKGLLTNKDNVIKVLIGLFVLLIVGMIVYWIYNAVLKSSSVDATNPLIIAGDVHTSSENNKKNIINLPLETKLPSTANSDSASLAYTMSFWVYVEKWENTDTEKYIMYKGTDKEPDSSQHVDQFSISLGANVNVLKIKTLMMSTIANGENKTQECNIRNFPLQKWVHVAYVLDNRSVDVYVNCKLERSCLLPNVPKLIQLPLRIPSYKNNGSNSNIFGKLASVRYFSEALRPVDVVQICNEGPFGTKGMKSVDNEASTDPVVCSTSVSDVVKSVLYTADPLTHRGSGTETSEKFRGYY